MHPVSATSNFAVLGTLCNQSVPFMEISPTSGESAWRMKFQKNSAEQRPGLFRNLGPRDHSDTSQGVIATGLIWEFVVPLEPIKVFEPRFLCSVTSVKTWTNLHGRRNDAEKWKIEIHGLQ
jgi:hypothetical protein